MSHDPSCTLCSRDDPARPEHDPGATEQHRRVLAEAEDRLATIWRKYSVEQLCQMLRDARARAGR